MGSLFGFMEAAHDVSYDAMYEYAQEAARPVSSDLHIEDTMTFIGVGGSSRQMNLGRIFARLTPRSERPDADHVIQQLRPKLAQIPTLNVICRICPCGWAG